MTVWIEKDLCDGCRRCLKACPYDAIELVDGRARVLDRCTGCGACIQACKQGAVKTDAAPRQVPDFSDRKGVWVFAEQRGGLLNPVSLELLGKARDLADTLGQTVTALLVGHRVGPLADALLAHGADTVLRVDHKILKDYRTNAYAKCLAVLAEEGRPNIFLLGASHIGRDLAPRVSRRLAAGLTADCTDLSIDPETSLMLQTRPAFGGNVMATIVNRYSRPQMATVRPGVMAARPGRRPAGQVVLRKIPVLEREIGTRVLEKVFERSGGEDLGAAKVIVAGGRGVGNARGFDLLRELADVMGGQVAGTRVAVEEGWVPPENQVGQTGRSVHPEIYVACGVSGAIQHRAGMTGSRYVVAVNRDPAAPIFQIADWGIVGDLFQVVPELIRQLRQPPGP